MRFSQPPRCSRLSAWCAMAESGQVIGDLFVAKDGSVLRGQAGKEFGLSLRETRDSLRHHDCH